MQQFQLKVSKLLMQNKSIYQSKKENKFIECPTLCGLQMQEKQIFYKKQPLAISSCQPPLKNFKKRSLKRSSPPEQLKFNEISRQMQSKCQLVSSRMMGSTAPLSISPSCCPSVQYSPRNQPPIYHSNHIRPAQEKNVFCHSPKITYLNGSIGNPFSFSQNSNNLAQKSPIKLLSKTRSLQELPTQTLTPDEENLEIKERTAVKIDIGNIEQFSIKEVVSEGQQERTEDQFSELVHSPYFSTLSHAATLTKFY